ncbi:hypothetical protein C8Q74DRAFT_1368921 [Fomes fomentarius]|nr:hypothetical protein C8Q74DRAFT_1368921 [Fomes fomentarius]
MLPNTAPEVSFSIRCHVGWKLLQEDDNSGNHNTTITGTVEVTKYKEISSRDYSKTVNESSREEAEKAHVNVSSSATWGPVSATVDAGFEGSKPLKDFVSSTTEVSREEKETWQETEKHEYSIGPGDKPYFYQQTFSGPGIYFKFTLDTTSVTSHKKGPEDDQDVDIGVVSTPVRFIECMDVAYGTQESDAPEDRVRTFRSGSDDINHSFKGKYVWLQPRWTYDTDKASTSFEIRIQKNHVEGWKDLAAGAGGDYRYVYSNHDENQTRKVADAALIRSSQRLSPEQQQDMLGKGWVGARRDINENRGGDYLYLAWLLY